MIAETQTAILRREIELIMNAAQAVQGSPFVPAAVKQLPTMLRHLQAWVGQTDARLELLEDRVRLGVG